MTFINLKLKSEYKKNLKNMMNKINELIISKKGDNKDISNEKTRYINSIKNIKTNMDNLRYNINNEAKNIEKNEETLGEIEGERDGLLNESRNLKRYRDKLQQMYYNIDNELNKNEYSPNIIYKQGSNNNIIDNNISNNDNENDNKDDVYQEKIEELKLKVIYYNELINNYNYLIEIKNNKYKTSEIDITNSKERMDILLNDVRTDVSNKTKRVIFNDYDYNRVMKKIKDLIHETFKYQYAIYKHHTKHINTFNNFNRQPKDIYYTNKQPLMHYMYHLIYEWYNNSFKQHEYLMFNKDKNIVNIYNNINNDLWFETRLFAHTMIRWYGNVNFNDEIHFVYFLQDLNNGIDNLEWILPEMEDIRMLYIDTIKKYYNNQFILRQSIKMNVFKNNLTSVKLCVKNEIRQFSEEIRRRNMLFERVKRLVYDKNDGLHQGLFNIVIRKRKNDSKKKEHKPQIRQQSQRNIIKQQQSQKNILKQGSQKNIPISRQQSQKHISREQSQKSISRQQSQTHISRQPSQQNINLSQLDTPR